MLELPVLGLLREQPMHGYELKKRLGETVGVVAGPSFGSLYPALRRLERAGAIEVVEPAPAPPAIPMTGSIGGETAAARWADRHGALRRRLTPTRRKRKEYRITERGLLLLEELLKAEADAGDDRAFALKLAFCRYLEPDDRLVLFERRRDWLTGKLARMRAALTEDAYTRSLVEHDGESTRRDLEWVERLIDDERKISGATRAGEQGATA